jgi:hypothetical protein
MTNYLKDGEAFRVMPDGSTVKLNRDEVIRDGERMIVPMTFMDGASKPGTQQPTFDAANARPRYGTMTQAQQAQSIASHHKMVERTNDAWRNPYTAPPAIKAAPVAAQASPAPVADANAAYDRMKKRQEDAWMKAK